MEKKFTPGPWIINDRFVDGPANSNNDHCICELFGPDSKANGLLIHSVYSMLEVLEEAIEFEEKQYNLSKEAVDWFNNNTPGVGQTIDYQTMPVLAPWVLKAKAAIAKAYGKG